MQNDHLFGIPQRGWYSLEARIVFLKENLFTLKDTQCARIFLTRYNANLVIFLGNV